MEGASEDNAADSFEMELGEQEIAAPSEMPPGIVLGKHPNRCEVMVRVP